MKAIYFRDIPQNVEAVKSRDPGFHLTGSTIYCWDVFTALLRFSTYDRFLLHRPTARMRDIFLEGPVYAENRNRITFLSPNELSAFRSFDNTVIFQNKADLHFGARLRRISGCAEVPITGVVHSLNYRYHLLNIARLLTTSLQPYDAIICSSRCGREVLLKYIELMKHRMRSFPGLDSCFQTPVIPLGVYTENFRADQSRAFLRASLQLDGDAVFLYVGRLSSKSKADLHPLLIAFARALSTRENAWLLLAGDDPNLFQTENLRQTAEQLGCASRIRIISNPSKQTKLDLYKTADVFVALSDNLQETFGISLIEAMAAGLPVVAADWNGYREIVVPDETGYLVQTMMPLYPPGFEVHRESSESADLLAATTSVDVSALTSIIVKLSENKQKRAEMGLAARKRARETYDWKVIIQRYEELWAELQKRARASTAVDLTPTLDFDDYDYRSVFSNYASINITSTTSFVLTELGRLCAGDPHLLETYCGASAITLGSTDFFALDQVSSILKDLTKVQQATVSELTDQREQNVDASLAMGLICRMAKFGLVKPA